MITKIQTKLIDRFVRKTFKMRVLKVISCEKSIEEDMLDVTALFSNNRAVRFYISHTEDKFFSLGECIKYDFPFFDRYDIL